MLEKFYLNKLDINNDIKIQVKKHLKNFIKVNNQIGFVILLLAKNIEKDYESFSIINNVDEFYYFLKYEKLIEFL